VAPRAKAQKIVSFLGLANAGRGKQGGKAASLRQILPARKPIVFTVAFGASVQAVAMSDAHQTSTRVPEAHPAVGVEGVNAGKFLIGEVGANPPAHGLF
jgi:predicted RNase H-like nuclease